MDYFSVPESETDTSESGKTGVSDSYVDKPSTSLRELSCTNTSSQIKCNQYSQNRMFFFVLAEICDWFPVSDGAGAFIAPTVLRDRLWNY